MHAEHRADVIYNLLQSYEYVIVKDNLMQQGFGVIVREGVEYLIIPNMHLDVLRTYFGPIIISNYQSNNCLFLDADCYRDDDGSVGPHIGSSDLKRIQQIEEKVNITSHDRLLEYLESRDRKLTFKGKLLVVPKDIMIDFFSGLETKYLLKLEIGNTSVVQDEMTKVSSLNTYTELNKEFVDSSLSAVNEVPGEIDEEKLASCDEMTTEEDIQDDNTVDRVGMEASRFVRNISIVNSLKALYGDMCQLCGSVTDFGFGETMSEVHHIRPLGNGHDGPDTQGNMVVVCPTHHQMFDSGALTINLKTG